ncbi:hypothetical protein B7494_g8405 [Chlorociboria aeruginascens]|nr:hypothetical protein B7494_g8405 [Chlorociboria aeruginascens]
MAPSPVAGFLSRRDNFDNCDQFGNCYSNSTWNNWGRWVALVVIIAFFIILALLFSCFSSRRRRRRGLAPMYGTGWMAKPPQGNYGQPPYYAHDQYNGAPPPVYSPPLNNQSTGNTFNSNDGYYAHHPNGGQQSGIELQPPQHTFQPQREYEPVYATPAGPPAGPPLRKGDDIIR